MQNTTLFRALCTSLLVAITCANANAQGIMTTWVGDSAAGYSGDGGPADMAQINYPYGVCFDGAGNFYIADQGNYAIRKVSSASNIITTIAGNGSSGYGGDSGPASSSVLSLVYGICTDPAGNIYFSDMANSVVRKINAVTGIITTVAGTDTTSGYSGDSGPAIAATLGEPQGICIYAGNLYITDYTNACIRKVNLATGIISTIAGNGTGGYTGDGGPAVAATLNGPSAICANAAGDLYIADESNFVIRKISAATGIISTIAGTGVEGYSGDDSAAINANIGFIDGICIDPYGNVYINDLSCSSRKINMATGIINTMAGSGTASGYTGDGGPATGGLLNWPAGLCIDPATGNIIIADAANNRIRRATQPGYFITTKTNNIAAEAQPAIYPNPSTGNFYIQVPDGQKYGVAQVTSIAGEKVYTSLLKANVNAINIPGIAGGNYIISIQSPSGSVFTQKITVNR
jgi:sugar lactone lactonase YvrE